MLLNAKLEKRDHQAEALRETTNRSLPTNSDRPLSNNPVSKAHNGRQAWLKWLQEVIQEGINAELSQGFRKFVLNMNYFLGLLSFLFGLWSAEILDTAANPFVNQWGSVAGIRKQKFFYHEAFAFGGSGYCYVTIGFFSVLMLSIFSLLLRSPVVITITFFVVIGFASVYFYGYYERKPPSQLISICEQATKNRTDLRKIDSDTEWRFSSRCPVNCGAFFGTLSAGTVMWFFMYSWICYWKFLEPSFVWVLIHFVLTCFLGIFVLKLSR